MRGKPTRLPLPPRYEVFDPAVHNVLVIIHPDYSEPLRSPSYSQAILEAATRALDRRIPVFLAPFESEPEWEQVIGNHLRRLGAQLVPEHGSGCSRVKTRWKRRRAQREVDEICAHVGLKPQSVRAAFGGMYANACVWAYANAWCRDVHAPPGDHPGDYDLLDDVDPPRRPIAAGDILASISVIC